MTWLSVVLIGLGVGDLVRSRDAAWARPAGHVTAALAIVVVAVLAGLTGASDVVAFLLSIGAGAVWIELSERTQHTGRHALLGLGAFGALVVLLLACSGWASTPDGPLTRWLHWADLPGMGVPSTDRVLLLTGLTLFNLATANVIVRLVLLAIGALRPDQVVASRQQPQPAQPADRLKGGRLLGPMERLVILGLGLVGEYGAAALVIAAKGVLRFPEIQASGRANGGAGTSTGRVGIDDVTEYFLVGSFVSWLVALVSLALTR